MSRWNLAWLLGVSAVTLVGLSLAFSFATTPGSIHEKHDNVRLLIDVMDEVQSKYVKELDRDKMREFVEDMINGGLEKLDPHSGFLNEEEYKGFTKHSEGKFGGVGIRIRVDAAGQIIVESPIVGTPAYKAGVMAGDVILKVDGKSTENMAVKDVVDMITGDPDTKVTLTVVHEGETKEEDLTMVRAVINIDSVLGDTPLDNAEKKWEYMIDKQHKVAYIRVVAFTHTTIAELTKLVQDLQDEGMKGLIIDLRNNPGGLLTTAVEMSGMFLEKGKKVVSTKGRNGVNEKAFYAQVPDDMRKSGLQQPINRLPVAILINRYSASASEIVAAALQDHARAVIIGERSFGKGSVQNIIEMEGRSTALKLTTASYHRPSGKNIHRFPDSKQEDDWGVKPDIEVKIDTKELIDYFKYRREKDVLLKPGGKHPEHDKILEFKDRVLEKAQEVIVQKIKEQDKKGAAAPAPVKQHQALLRPAAQPQLLHSKAVAPRRFLWCQEEKLAAPFTFGLCLAEPPTLAAPYLAALPCHAAPAAAAAAPRLLV